MNIIDKIVNVLMERHYANIIAEAANDPRLKERGTGLEKTAAKEVLFLIQAAEKAFSRLEVLKEVLEGTLESQKELVERVFAKNEEPKKKAGRPAKPTKIIKKAKTGKRK